MSFPQILITGFAARGKTFIELLLWEIGYDLGNVCAPQGVSNETNIRAKMGGLEFSKLTENINYPNALKKIDYPQLVKVPDLNPLDIEAINPALVIVCAAGNLVEGRLTSVQREEAEYINGLLDSFLKREQPFIFLPFPSFIRSAAICYAQLKSLNLKGQTDFEPFAALHTFVEKYTHVYSDFKSYP